MIFYNFVILLFMCFIFFYIQRNKVIISEKKSLVGTYKVYPVEPSDSAFEITSDIFTDDNFLQKSVLP